MTAIRTFDPDSDMAALKVCLFGLQDFEVGLDPQSLAASVRFIEIHNSISIQPT